MCMVPPRASPHEAAYVIHHASGEWNRCSTYGWPVALTFNGRWKDWTEPRQRLHAVSFNGLKTKMYWQVYNYTQQKSRPVRCTNVRPCSLTCDWRFSSSRSIAMFSDRKFSTRPEPPDAIMNVYIRGGSKDVPVGCRCPTCYVTSTVRWSPAKIHRFNCYFRLIFGALC